MKNNWFGTVLLAVCMIFSMALTGCPTEEDPPPPVPLYTGVNTKGETFVLNTNYSFVFKGTKDSMMPDITVTGKIVDIETTNTGNFEIQGETADMRSPSHGDGLVNGFNGNSIILTFDCLEIDIGPGTGVTVSSTSEQLINQFFGDGGPFILQE